MFTSAHFSLADGKELSRWGDRQDKLWLHQKRVAEQHA